MSTNLSGNTLTLNNTVLNEEIIKIINRYYYIPNNCKVGDTVILDGIECLCVATGVTIQGSNLTRIAVDKNHDLGYYQRYLGIRMVSTGNFIEHVNYWRWGGSGTTLGNTSIEVGYGLQNTINCLARTEAYTNGSNEDNDTYPVMWLGVNDFRSSHSDKWFLPSQDELKNYVYPYKDMLTFDENTGGKSTDFFWSSSEYSDTHGRSVYFSQGVWNGMPKSGNCAVRLCRAF